MRNIEDDYLFFLIKFDGNVKYISTKKIRSREEFELKCVMYLDTHYSNYEIDNFMYIEHGEVLYTYNINENKEKIK